jgi:hypothetical protein
MAGHTIRADAKDDGVLRFYGGIVVPERTGLFGAARGVFGIKVEYHPLATIMAELNHLVGVSQRLKVRSHISNLG